MELRERRDLQKKQLLVGSLFTAAILLACLLAYWMGAFAFGPTRTLLVGYNFAGGVERGSPVRLAGVRVGRVSDVRFLSEADTSLELELSLSREAFGRITQDSRFYVNLAGLIGERYVEVVPGQGPPVSSGDRLRGEDPPRVDQLFSQGYGIFGDLRGFFEENRGDLQQMLRALNDLTGNLNTLVAHATPEQRKQLNTMLKNFSELSVDLKLVTSALSRGLSHVEKDGGAQAWSDVVSLLERINQVQLNDLRRLMLEDGVKVNFSSRKVQDRVQRNVTEETP